MLCLRITVRYAGLFLVGSALLLLGGCSEESTDASLSSMDSEPTAQEVINSSPGEQLENAAGEAVDLVTDGIVTAWDSASSAMKDMEDGREMLQGIRDAYKSAEVSFSEVTSKETAMKARADIDALSDKLEQWRPKLAEMSDEAKDAAKRFFDVVAGKLSRLAEQLNENEWVNTILRPRLQELIEQLKSLG